MKWQITALILIFSFSTQQGFSQDLRSHFKKNDLKPMLIKDGLYYEVEKKGKGGKAKEGDYVLINYKGLLLDGTEFDATEKNEPYAFRLGYRQVIKGWDRGLQEFQEGSKGVLYIPNELAYGKAGVGGVIPPNADLIYEVELLKIMDSKQYNEYMKKLEKKEREHFERKKKEQFLVDKKIIQEYALKNKLRTKRTTSGVTYALTKKGKGKTAEKGDKLEVHYEGQLMDGTVFDSSFDKKPFAFTLGRGKAIDGWEDALLNFKKGSEGWILIPSALAYGPRSIREGKINIPANSVLIFKIKLVELKEKNKSKKKPKSK